MMKREKCKVCGRYATYWVQDPTGRDPDAKATVDFYCKEHYPYHGYTDYETGAVDMDRLKRDRDSLLK